MERSSFEHIKASVTENNCRRTEAEERLRRLRQDLPSFNAMCDKDGWTATVQEVMRLMCDVILVVDGHSIPAHKEVLCASSSYFKVMFEGSFKESGSTEVNMTESIRSVDTLNTVLKFMYLGRLEVTAETLQNILEVSSFLLIEDAKEICAKFMLENLTFNNWLHMWSTAEYFYLEGVSEACLAMARCRFRDSLQHLPEILNVDENLIVKIAKEGILSFLDWTEIGSLLLRWLEEDPAERYGACREVLELLRHKLAPFTDSASGCALSEVRTVEEIRTFLSRLSGFKGPHLELKLKVLVSRPCRQTPGDKKRYDVIYLYVPQQDKWYIKDVVIEDVTDVKKDDIDSSVFIGGTKEGLVFKKTNGEIFVCLLQDDGFEWLSLQQDYHNFMAKECTCVVWDGQLMMIEGSTGPCGVDHSLFRYEFRSRSWVAIKTKTLKADSSTYYDTISLRHFSTPEVLYIVTVLGSNNQRVALSKLRSGCNGYYLWEAVPQHLPLLRYPWTKDQDFEATISELELRLKLGSNLIVVSLEETHQRPRLTRYMAEAESCWPVTSRPPAWLPSGEEGFQVLRVDSEMVVPRQSAASQLQGYFFIQVLGKYMTRCWRGVGEPKEPQSFVWMECTPLPTQSLRSFSSVEIARSLLKYFRPADFIPTGDDIKKQSIHDAEHAYSLHHGFA